MVTAKIYNTKLKKHFILICLLLSIFLSASLWADVKATTDRTIISIDETITLTIHSKNGSGEPDLSVLEKDFQILGQSERQNYSLINGHASSTHTWTITLLAKNNGEQNIPAIKVGNETTQAIPLVIQKQSTTPALDGREVFLKMQLTPRDNVYVQQQILITVQLYHRIRLANASLTELELEDTVVEKLGNDRNFSKVIGKYRYNVIERQYAIYPQQSGSLTIPSLTFSGNKEIGQNFSLFSRPGQPLISRTSSVTIKVLPVPASYTGKQWLPAESLVLESEILEDTSNIKSGEAITRHIIIRATGLLGSQLPAVTMPASSHYKTYPDKEKLNNQQLNGKVIGSRKDTIAIIPLQAGQFTLPEIKISWWNIISNTQETAVLPERILTALPNADIQAMVPSKSQAEAQKSQLKQQNHGGNQRNSSSEVKTVEKLLYKIPHFKQDIWFWISIALLVVWLITLILYFDVRSRKKRHKAGISPALPAASHEKFLQCIYTACQENNASTAQQELINWARIYFNQPTLSGLADIGSLTEDEALIQAINALEESKYSSHQQDWKGLALEQALKDFMARKKQETSRKKQQQAFVPLNP